MYEEVVQLVRDNVSNIEDVSIVPQKSGGYQLIIETCTKDTVRINVYDFVYTEDHVRCYLTLGHDVLPRETEQEIKKKIKDHILHLKGVDPRPANSLIGWCE